jgi:hypothetical protein
MDHSPSASIGRPDIVQKVRAVAAVLYDKLAFSSGTR